MYSLPDAAGFEQTQAQVRVSRTLNTSCSSLPDAYLRQDQADHATVNSSPNLGSSGNLQTSKASPTSQFPPIPRLQ